MLRAIFSRYISGMEKDWNYDASYMREILATSPWTFLKFGVVTAVVPRRDAPADDDELFRSLPTSFAIFRVYSKDHRHDGPIVRALNALLGDAGDTKTNM